MECPNCGNRFLRPSRPRTLQERLESWFFVSPVRCDHCSHRFVTDILGLAYIGFARCPKCHRMDLNRWTGESYHPKGITKFKVMFGARRFRCEYCRLNFASFRRRKEVFSFHRWARIENARKAEANPDAPVVPREKRKRINPDRRRDQG